ncbi:hypothetical protein K1719_019287 [Acacia pycnantha]|nr:hypothetical protein K1719_019287 [Acacia pycnantha]
MRHIHISSNAKVWSDRWLPGLPNDRLQSELVSEKDKKMRVADLIVDGRWNLSSIMQRISAEGKRCILQVKIEQNNGRDKAIWLKCKDGNYCVKSGYHVAKGNEKKEVVQGPSSSHQ